MARHSSEGCSAKEGNPFGPFWDHFAVDFSNSSFYGPLHYDMHYGDMAREWGEKYSPQEWPGEERGYADHSVAMGNSHYFL